jgi:serine/threonine protein kinase
MDIYALGATLYNMLTKTPVNSKKLIELMNAMTSNPGSGRTASDLKSAWNSFNPDFDRIAKLAPAVSVLKKMLDKDPRRRPPAGTAAALLHDLGDKSLS